MTEVERRRDQSPLVSERGVTTIRDNVVSQIAGMAAQEVEGVHMGGSASRAAGGVFGTMTGSETQTRGISVSVGRIETAIDLTMGIDYGRNFLETVEEVRRRIVERVENITGLRVVECNATISEVIFPDDGDGRSGELESRPREQTEVISSAQTREKSQSGPLSEEEGAEGRPVEEEETAVLRAGDDESRAEDETREIERGPLADEPERGERREES
ncbi:MAG TPA: Asp23/Gls24 family envelope stress response protein [Rubrobacteraceae bacterium]|nr:Asp23/Gls24 family envelope stress response protein [Rubrobacteraceae bacterium]